MGEKVKLVCSYGGKLRASPIGKNLIYCGGDTKLIIVNRNIDFQELVAKLSYECSGGGIFMGLKYQLPGEDFDVLLSITDDDDLEYMMLDYDNVRSTLPSSVKSSRIKIFLDFKMPSKKNTNLNPDYIFGFDKDTDYGNLIDDKALEEWRIPPAKKYDQDDLTARCQQRREDKNQDSKNGSGDEEAVPDSGDYICSVCHTEGNLILCDHCPSAFHAACVGFKDVPEGTLFCPPRCCRICHAVADKPSDESYQDLDVDEMTARCEERRADKYDENCKKRMAHYLCCATLKNIQHKRRFTTLH